MHSEFWQQGLPFSCQQCSACCRHKPGFVFLSKLDIINLLKHFAIDFSTFLAKFSKTVDVGTGYVLSLKENDQYDCILWQDGGCTAYSVRPVQCRTYPFWQGIIDDQDSWLEEATDCPGIGTGPVIPPEKIQECLWSRRFHKPLVLSYDIPLEELDADKILGGEGLDTDSNDS
jgi:Fe-S-cluster containining protein